MKEESRTLRRRVTKGDWFGSGSWPAEEVVVKIRSEGGRSCQDKSRASARLQAVERTEFKLKSRAGLILCETEKGGPRDREMRWNQ